MCQPDSLQCLKICDVYCVSSAHECTNRFLQYAAVANFISLSLLPHCHRDPTRQGLGSSTESTGTCDCDRQEWACPVYTQSVAEGHASTL